MAVYQKPLQCNERMLWLIGVLFLASVLLFRASDQLEGINAMQGLTKDLTHSNTMASFPIVSYYRTQADDEVTPGEPIVKSPNVFNLSMRKRVQLFHGDSPTEEVITQKQYRADELAILTLGMWSTHQCLGSAQRLDEMAPKMDAVLKHARAKGVQIIWGGSTWEVNEKAKWEATPMRKKMKGLPFSPIRDYGLFAPPLPIDDSDGGCDTGPTPNYRRDAVGFHPGIEMDQEKDVLSAKAKEVLNFLKHKNIKLLLVMGAHTNMCILDRPYAMKMYVRYGFPVALVRDLTDAMYNPAKYPYVSQAEGTELVVQYIESYIAPSIHSDDLMSL